MKSNPIERSRKRHANDPIKVLHESMRDNHEILKDLNGGLRLMKSNPIERSRKRHNNDLQERLNRRTFQQVVTRTNGKRLIKRPLVKPIYGTVDKLEMVAYGKNKKPLLLTRIQRCRKEVITTRMIPLAKNPNKIEIYKSSVSRLNVFTYIGNNTYIYIANHGSFVDIPREEVKPMCEAILCFLEKDSQ